MPLIDIVGVEKYIIGKKQSWYSFVAPHKIERNFEKWLTQFTLKNI